MYADNLVRTIGKSGQSGRGTSTKQSYQIDHVTMVENRTQKCKRQRCYILIPFLSRGKQTCSILYSRTACLFTLQCSAFILLLGQASSRCSLWKFMYYIHTYKLYSCILNTRLCMHTIRYRNQTNYVVMCKKLV